MIIPIESILLTESTNIVLHVTNKKYKLVLGLLLVSTILI
jgi:hypothetical protein